MADNFTFKDASGTTKTAQSTDNTTYHTPATQIVSSTGGIAADDAAAAGPIYPLAGYYSSPRDGVDGGDIGRVAMLKHRELLVELAASGARYVYQATLAMTAGAWKSWTMRPQSGVSIIIHRMRFSVDTSSTVQKATATVAGASYAAVYAFDRVGYAGTNTVIEVDTAGTPSAVSNVGFAPYLAANTAYTEDLYLGPIGNSSNPLIFKCSASCNLAVEFNFSRVS